ncbi:MAG: MATE family efflux transporter [Spirochaetota bacterium]
MEDLTQGSIRKHMNHLALPSILGSLFTTLYNVVDTFWAGKVGLSSPQTFSELFHYAGDVRALTGMTVSFPIFLIMLSLSIGLLNGAIGLFGNAIGQKNNTLLHTYFAQSLIYALIVSLLLLLSLPLLPLFFSLMGAHDPVVLSYAHKYISTIIAGSSLFTFTFVFSAALIARGNTKTQRNISIFNFFLNMILDPLFLFGFGPIPAMGLRGIAIATLISQLLGLLVMYIKLRDYQAFSEINCKLLAPKWPVLGLIARQSIPPTLNMAAVSFLLGLVNRYANTYGGAPAVAAYGISLRIEQIALIPSMGVGTALTSIASQNNGAGKIDRMLSAYRIALLAGLVFLIGIMMPLGWFFSETIAGLFTQDPATIAIAKKYLGVCVLIFFAYMLITFSGSIFQAAQIPQVLSYLTIARSCILPLLTFTLFPVTFGLGLDGLWLAILFNNWLAGLIACILCLRVLYKKLAQAQKIQTTQTT